MYMYKLLIIEYLEVKFVNKVSGKLEWEKEIN